MPDTVYEVKIVEVANMPQSTAKYIHKQISQMTQTFKENYKGYAKVVYATASPPKVVSIEPIEGYPTGFFKKAEEEIGADANVF